MDRAAFLAQEHLGDIISSMSDDDLSRVADAILARRGELAKEARERTLRSTDALIELHAPHMRPYMKESYAIFKATMGGAVWSFYEDKVRVDYGRYSLEGEYPDIEAMKEITKFYLECVVDTFFLEPKTPAMQWVASRARDRTSAYCHCMFVDPATRNMVVQTGTPKETIKQYRTYRDNKIPVWPIMVEFL